MSCVLFFPNVVSREHFNPKSRAVALFVRLFRRGGASRDEANVKARRVIGLAVSGLYEDFWDFNGITQWYEHSIPPSSLPSFTLANIYIVWYVGDNQKDLPFGRRGCCADESASECPGRAVANRVRIARIWSRNPCCASNRSSASRTASSMGQSPLRRCRAGSSGRNHTTPPCPGRKPWTRHGPLRRTKQRRRTPFHDNLEKQNWFS